MRHTTITARDLECLEHMRNVGQLVGELMQVQDCATIRRDPAQQLQLTSVIYLMTAQLDGVVERCNQRWLTLCERQHRYQHLTLDALESAIAVGLEGFYLRQYGEEKGRLIACALLEDLMEAGPLKAVPSLSFLGLAVMDELCARHIKSLVLH
ncbi:hypothetical protein F1B88_21240 [Escherichia coli]|nr:hypothetical protein [Escherichia coli]